MQFRNSHQARAQLAHDLLFSFADDSGECPIMGQIVFQMDRQLPQKKATSEVPPVCSLSNSFRANSQFVLIHVSPYYSLPKQIPDPNFTPQKGEERKGHCRKHPISTAIVEIVREL
jgi:hypothetical protein